MTPGWWRAKESTAPLPVEPVDRGAVAATAVVEDVLPTLLREVLNYCDNCPGPKSGNLVDSLCDGFRQRVEAALASTPEGQALTDRWNGIVPEPVKRRPFNVWNCDASMEDDDA